MKTIYCSDDADEKGQPGISGNEDAVIPATETSLFILFHVTDIVINNYGTAAVVSLRKRVMNIKSGFYIISAKQK